MSYCYDVMTHNWELLRQLLPKDVRDDELAIRFGFLIDEMHEANHRLKDAINKDHRVHKAASALDRANKAIIPEMKLLQAIKHA